jgi:cobalamin synthase
MVETRATDRLPPDKPGQRMQRVRVGVTGLAAILLVVLLATAIASGLRRSVANETAIIAPPPLVPTVAAPMNTAGANAEPLAQLGAAPGGAPAAAAPTNATAK